MGLKWDMGCGESGADHKINTSEREAMLHVFGEIAKENRLVKVMSKPLEGEQMSMVPLHGKPDEKRGNCFC